ncbi:hypothetical protein RRG08_029772 [Elysia crispata]|uniref:Uncharacterized protein n=1 Tax=Elysia crispata TaxID=231223 RepID=A0AAE1B6B6_9GAST|nr:hypothetical protein RRG08_029772 [Elysia crispata]
MKRDSFNICKKFTALMIDAGNHRISLKKRSSQGNSEQGQRLKFHFDGSLDPLKNAQAPRPCHLHRCLILVFQKSSSGEDLASLSARILGAGSDS